MVLQTNLTTMFIETVATLFAHLELLSYKYIFEIIIKEKRC